MNEDKKCLLVLGASSEFGCKLIARVSENYDVILAHYCHSEGGLTELKRTLGEKLITLQADFLQKSDIETMIKSINDMSVSPLHIVFMTANKFRNVKFVKAKLDDYQDELDISLMALIQILEVFIPTMIKRKRGKIIVMLSSCTVNIPPRYISPYVVSKYALLGLVKALASEYSDKGITVNAVSPEMTETKFLSEIPDLIVEKNAQAMPIGRNLTVSDVVPAFEYLLSPGADCLTGQNLAITAGK